MLVLTFSSKLDWGSYIISIAKTASKKIEYVPTLQFWMGGSPFHWAAPVLLSISEISSFEIILAWMS